MLITLHCHFCHHFFFFNDTATTEIYTLSLHDALPISEGGAVGPVSERAGAAGRRCATAQAASPTNTVAQRSGVRIMAIRVPGDGDSTARRRPFVLADRKSTRLNSSH